MSGGMRLSKKATRKVDRLVAGIEPATTRQAFVEWLLDREIEELPPEDQ